MGISRFGAYLPVANRSLLQSLSTKNEKERTRSYLCVELRSNKAPFSNRIIFSFLSACVPFQRMNENSANPMVFTIVSESTRLSASNSVTRYIERSVQFLVECMERGSSPTVQKGRERDGWMDEAHSEFVGATLN